MKKVQLISGIVLALALMASGAMAHCEIPCGIYDDSARVDEMREHVTTIEKSMNQANELAAAGDKNYNQLVRWIMNKEDHANRLQEVATQYFMFQRIKPVDPTQTAEWEQYQIMLTLMHRITVEAMKCKQTTDLAHVENLRGLIDDFAEVYFEQK